MRRVQRGVSLLVVAIVLVGIIASILAAIALFKGSTDNVSSSRTAANMAKARAALEQFASVTGRLPCPANPLLTTGVENRAPGAVDCPSAANGTLPWSTIGLSQDDSLDAWGWRIAYRAYSGATGLTQDNGATMVHCDTVRDPLLPVVALAGGMCETVNHDNTVAQYRAAKGVGLTVNDFGTVVTDVAFVLISHGPSGRGAFTVSGTQTAVPAFGGDERANLDTTTAAGTFISKAEPPKGTPADDPNNINHFDDVIVYEKVLDLVRRANLEGRDWPNPAPVIPPPVDFANLRMDTATLTAALGAAPGANTGQQTITFINAVVTGFNSGGDQTIAFDNVGTEGIGVVGGAGGIGSIGGEGLRIDFTKQARQFAITLDDFGVGTFIFFGFPIPDYERVEFAFFNGGSPVMTVQKMACHASPPSQLGSFSINVGSDFDRVEIRAIATLPFASTTSFFVSEFKSCAASPAVCVTSMDTGPAPGGNRCS